MYQMMVFEEFYKEFFFSLNDALKERGYCLVLTSMPSISIHEYIDGLIYPPGVDYDLQDRHALITRILELLAKETK